MNWLRLRIWWLGVEINLVRRKLTRKYRSEPAIRGHATRKAKA